MKYFFLYINVIFIIFSSSAQIEYALFPHDSLKFASENYEFPLVKDSIIVEDGISNYYLAPTYNFDLNNPEQDAFLNYDFDTIQNSAIYWKLANWFGDSISSDSIGNYTFENRAGQLFEIRSKATLGEIWNLVEFENGDYIEAQVDSLVIGNTIDNSDTTKYISLTKLDSFQTVIVGDINEQALVIGQNSGLVASPGFFEYPYRLEYYQSNGFILEETPIEETNRYKVWNMEIEDEFHVMEDHHYWYESEQLKIVITDKYWDPLNHKFTYHKHISTRSYGPIYDVDSNYVLGYSVDESDVVETISLDEYKFLDSALLGNSSFGPSGEYSVNYAKAKFNEDFFYIGQQISSYEENNNFWYMYWMIQDPWNPHYLDRYIEGCGGGYINHHVNFILDEQYTIYQLDYYKKGDLTWGNPYNIGLEEIAEETISLYPNPTKGEFTVHLDDEYENIDINIYNSLGQKVQTMQLENQQIIDLRLEGSAGYYMVEIILNNQYIVNKRIIKRS